MAALAASGAVGVDAAAHSAEVASVDDAIADPDVAAPKAEGHAEAVEAERESFWASFATRAFSSALQPILAIAAALLVGAIIIVLLGKNPATAYGQLFTSGFSSAYGISSSSSTSFRW